MTQQTDLTERLTSLAENASGSAQAIATFLLLEGTGVAELSMDALASRTFTSKASLSRFAQRLGFAGWSDFRKTYLAEARVHELESANTSGVDVNYPFVSSDRPLEALAKIVRVRELAMREVSETLDEKALDEAAEHVLQARQVLYVSRVNNYHYGKLFATNMMQMGVICRVLHSEEVMGLAPFITSDDCVIAVTYAGNLESEPFTHLAAMQGRGAYTIGITSAQSPLSAFADAAFTFRSLEHYYSKIAGFYSEACVQLVLDTLFATCYTLRYDDYLTARARLAQELNRTMTVNDNLVARI